MKIPPFDQGKRKESFSKVIDILLKKRSMTFVELGMTRNENVVDGHSTPLFSYIAHKTNSFLYSVDISPKSIIATTKLLEKYGLYDPKRISLVLNDANIFLEGFQASINFLYIDAWSYEPEERKTAEEEALRSFKLAENKFVTGSLILIDDVLDPESYLGKGKLAIPYAMNQGYKCLHAGYQFLFAKT